MLFRSEDGWGVRVTLGEYLLTAAKPVSASRRTGACSPPTRHTRGVDATAAGLSPATVLVAATALHAGFQAVVTLLVYPALAEHPAAGWRGAHERHSRRIVGLVGVVYASVLGACAYRLTDPLDVATVIAYAGSALALGTTAFGAAPTHGRLSSAAGPQDRAPLLRRLLALDRIRLVGAVLALGASLAAASIAAA